MPGKLRMEQQNWKGIIERGEGLMGEREWKLRREGGRGAG